MDKILNKTGYMLKKNDSRIIKVLESSEVCCCRLPFYCMEMFIYWLQGCIRSTCLVFSQQKDFLTIIFCDLQFTTRLSHTTQILCCHYLNIVYKACLIFTFHS